VEVSRESVGLRPRAEVWLYAPEMEEKLGSLGGGQKLESTEAAEELAQAVRLYCGEFLEGFFLRGCLELESWQLRQRERLHRLAVTALHYLAAYSLDRGDYPAGLDYATRLLELDPLMESAHRQMMKMLT
jgi:DNA-binding SARP family transcriptional activator